MNKEIQNRQRANRMRENNKWNDDSFLTAHYICGMLLALNIINLKQHYLLVKYISNQPGINDDQDRSLLRRER